MVWASPHFPFHLRALIKIYNRTIDISTKKRVFQAILIENTLFFYNRTKESIPAEIVEMLNDADQIDVDTSVPSIFDCMNYNTYLLY